MSNLKYPKPYEQSEYVWKEWSKGRYQKDIANEFGVPTATIQRICSKYQDEGKVRYED